MASTIRSGQVVLLAFPGHPLLSIRGEAPPPHKLRESILFAWNGELEVKGSTSWLWRENAQEVADVSRNRSILEPY